jgi:hypothetical protein
MSLYDQDFYQWTQQQAALLKAGALSQLDIENLTEEIESMGKSQKKELISRLVILLMHMLKWDHQSDRRGRSWLKTIATQRTEIEILLYDNPSLKNELPNTVLKAYRLAVKQASTENGLGIGSFPLNCTYAIEQIMGDATQ